jgi:hypothetical protein
MIGFPVEHDPRWTRLGGLNRSRAVLGSNALSGHYYGVTLTGPHAVRLRNDG